MSPGDYVLVATTIAGLALVIAVTTSKPPRKASEAPKEVTRWKRFKVQPTSLHGALKESAQIVAEEPQGLKLSASPRESPKRVRVGSPDGKVQVEIARVWRPFRRIYRVSLGGKEWLRLLLNKSRPKEAELESMTRNQTYELRGALADREYEILRNGKLVATVSWQRPPGDSAPKKEYILETVKTEDALPLLTIALAVEVALG